ncbi:elongin-A3 member B-like [Erinaceus europaeus]|uniref:Elongin-A3 member B-like n=1 Tax=Erinaceus europaeus TaxID=9365 RepID=A0ABM3WF52_ERIEU|nr:elongin-A3 member B-like [Erinaceus europaeus]
MELEKSVLIKAQELQADLDCIPHPKKFLRLFAKLLMLPISPDILRQTSLCRSVRRLLRYEQLGCIARDLTTYWQIIMEKQKIQESEARASARSQAPKGPQEADHNQDPQGHREAPEGQASTNPELSLPLHRHKRHRGCSKHRSPQTLSSEQSHEALAHSQGQPCTMTACLKACKPQHEQSAQDSQAKPQSRPDPWQTSQETPSLSQQPTEEEAWELPAMSFEAYLQYDQPNSVGPGHHYDLHLWECSSQLEQDSECPFSRRYSKTPVFAGSLQNSLPRGKNRHQQGVWGQHKEKALSQPSRMPQPLLKPSEDMCPPLQSEQLQKTHQRLKGETKTDGNQECTRLLKQKSQPQHTPQKTRSLPLQEAQGRRSGGQAARDPGPRLGLHTQPQGSATDRSRPGAQRPPQTLNKPREQRGASSSEQGISPSAPEDLRSSQAAWDIHPGLPEEPTCERPLSNLLSSTKIFNTNQKPAKKTGPLMAKSRKDFQKMLQR